MARIDVKYENWKNKLLDLGKRNKLLNYKETKSSTLKITYPDYSALYKKFVQNEDELRDRSGGHGKRADGAVSRFSGHSLCRFPNEFSVSVSGREAASAAAEGYRIRKRRQQQQGIAKWYCSGFIPRVSWVRFPFQTAPCFAQCRWKPVCILDHLWWETVRSVTDGSYRIRPGFTERKTGRNGN